jgi:hypothetical protein
VGEWAVSAVPELTGKERMESKLIIPQVLLDSINGMEPKACNDELGGRVFRFGNSYGFDAYRYPQMQELLALVGFMFSVEKGRELLPDNSPVKHYDIWGPDTERLQNACDLAEVPISLEINDSGHYGHMTEEHYGSVLRLSRKHPVSVASLEPYRHDIGSAHLPVAVLLGEDLFRFCEQGGGYIERPAHVYDSFTANLSPALGYLFKGRGQEAIDQLNICIDYIFGVNSTNHEEKRAELERIIRTNLDRLGINVRA